MRSTFAAVSPKSLGERRQWDPDDAEGSEGGVGFLRQLGCSGILVMAGYSGGDGKQEAPLVRNIG
jgi:hypothetical protein